MVVAIYRLWKRYFTLSNKARYYLYDVPNSSTRGGHAHKLQQCLIALSGSFIVVVDDGQERKEILLNRPDKDY